MSNLSELRQSARQYSGSYRIIEDRRNQTIDGVRLSYIRYTNPNNITNNEYIEWKTKNHEGGLTTTSNSTTLDTIRSNITMGVIR
jgi:IMP cyclohydrolase